jgi:hypothetical protein
MTPTSYALCVALHGHAAWLGVALLAHPVVLLGRPGGAVRARGVALLACALVGVPWAAGAWLYPTYRSAVKPGLLSVAPSVALAFEAKEHLAYLSLVLMLSGTCVLVAAGATAQRLARRLLGAALVCGIVVGALGVYVGAHSRPGWP